MGTVADESMTRHIEEMYAGDTALEAGRRADAQFHYRRALSCLDAVADDDERRRALGTATRDLLRHGFLNLAIGAAREALALDEKAGDLGGQGGDLIVLSLAQLQLGQVDEPAANLRRALEICLTTGDLECAASASTNLAMAISRDLGWTPEAVGLLWNSLDYLEKQKNDDIEIASRIALVQALEAGGHDPEAVFKVTRVLYDRFAGVLRPDQWETTLGTLERAMGRHQQAHPKLDMERFKRQRFPELPRR